MHLDAQLLPQPPGMHTVRLDVTQGDPNVSGAIIIADRLPSPIPLPYTHCELLLDPLGIIGPINLDSRGMTRIDIPVQQHWQ